MIYIQRTFLTSVFKFECVANDDEVSAEEFEANSRKHRPSVCNTVK